MSHAPWQELASGQITGLCTALLFLVPERFRLRSWLLAAAEAFRLWGFMVFSVLTVWLAQPKLDQGVWIGLAVASPILAAMIVNNAYAALRRRIERNR